MKIWLCCFVLFLFSGICLAQRPAPALIPGANEVSVSFIYAQKGQSLSNYGFGGQIAGNHYFDEHVGFELQSDYIRTDFSNVRDAGVRVGPVMRFATKHAVQPYVEFLAGYARVESSYLRPVTSFHGSGSILAGGGVDFPLSGGWHAKAGADFEDDWNVCTRVGRGVLGISYRFAAR